MLIASCRGFHQLIQGPGRDDDLAGGAGTVRRLGGGPVVAAAVVQHRLRVVGVGQCRALAPVPGAAGHLPGQFGRARRVPAPRGEQQRDVGQGGLSGPRVDALTLHQQGRRLGQLAGLDVDLGEIVQRERKPAEGAVRSRLPDLAGREIEPRLVVPQVHGDDVVRDGQPVQLVRLRPVAAQCLLQRRGGGQVPIGQAHGQAVNEQLRVRQRLRPGGPGVADLAARATCLVSCPSASRPA